MKRKISFFAIAVIAAGVLVFACSKKNSVRDVQTQQEFIKVGHIDNTGKGLAILDLSIPEVVSFMQENNSFAEDNYNYSYETAWIETLYFIEEGERYYLAVSGVEKNENGSATCDCYTVYTSLTKDGEDLITDSSGSQDKCTGYCCSSCMLKPADQTHENPWCDCTTPSTTPSCENEARCDHSMVTGGTNSGK